MSAKKATPKKATLSLTEAAKLAEAKRTAPADEGDGRNFFEKVGHGVSSAVAGVPRGVVKLVVGGAKEAAKIHSRAGGAPTLTGTRNKDGDLVIEGLPRALVTPKKGETVKEAMRREFPVTTEIVESAGRTVGRVRHPSRIPRDYGRDPVGTLLEDVSNVAPALKGAGAATKSVGLAKAAETLDKIAAAPVKPYQAAFRAPAAVGDAALRSATRAAAEGRAPGKFATAATKLSTTSKAVTDEILAGKADEEALADRQARRALAVRDVLPERFEQEAATVIAEGTAPALAALRRHLPKGEFERYVADRYEGTLSPQAAHLAADLAEGKSPTLTARVDEALARGREGRGGRAERQTEFLADPAHAYQAGYEPNPTAVERAVSQASIGLARAQRQAEQARLRADAATPGTPRAAVLSNVARSAETRARSIAAKGERARATAEFAVENAPARLKPMLAENRAATKRLTAVVNDLRKQGLLDAAARVERELNDLPTTLEQLRAAGADAEHLFHTTEGVRLPSARRTDGLPRTFKPGSEKLRKGSPVYDRTVAGQFAGEREALVAAARRATVERIARIPGAVVRLGEGPLEHARTLDDARAAGFVPWNPSSIFDTQGQVRSLSDIEAALGATGTTMFMPKPLFEQLRNYYAPPGGQTLGLITDVPNRLYVLGGLALSPGYITGQIVGNYVLGVAGSSSPGAFGSQLLKVVKEYRRTGAFPEAVPARVTKSGSAAAELSRLTKEVEGRGGRIAAASRGLNAALNRPLHLASFLDNTTRAAFFLTELSKRGNPEAALRATLRSVGEFDRMTPFERDVIRRVIPFWAWHKTVTKIAFNLAADHPLRIAWTLHLGDTVGEPDGPLPRFFEDTIPIGGKLVGADQAFPHGQVGNVFGGGFLGVGKIAGPVPKLAIGSLTGLNPSTGRPFSRPYGTGRDDGRTPTAPSIARQVARLFPQTRLVEGLAGRDTQARYSTGEELRTPLPTGRDRLTAITEALGVPLYNNPNDLPAREAEVRRRMTIAEAAKLAASKRRG